MALINQRAREIHFKIVYYGPGLGGKTTNLKVLHDRLPPERRGKMISIATDHERTLFFDFLPLDLGQVNGFSTRFHLYTVPGQVYYRLSRRAVLQGVDGVVFVADSHPAREQANRESLADLGEHLATLGLTPVQAARLPRVFQYNKRDLPGAVAVERMRALLNPGGLPDYEAIASESRGVSETLKAVCKLVLARLTTEPAVESNGPMPVLVMRRPGRAQLEKITADAVAAEAAAEARSQAAQGAAAGPGMARHPLPAHTVPGPAASPARPLPPRAPTPVRSIIAPPSVAAPRPVASAAPVAPPPVAAPRPAPPVTTRASAPTAPARSAPGPVVPPVRSTDPVRPLAGPAAARPAMHPRPLFSWLRAAVSRQRPPAAAHGAAPAAAPAPPVAVSPGSAAPPIVGSALPAPEPARERPAPSPAATTPQSTTPRMVWGRTPRPATPRGAPRANATRAEVRRPSAASTPPSVEPRAPALENEPA